MNITTPHQASMANLTSILTVQTAKKVAKVKIRIWSVGNNADIFGSFIPFVTERFCYLFHIVINTDGGERS